MASRMTFLAKFRNIFQNIEALLYRIHGQHPGMYGAPALCYDGQASTPSPSASKDPLSALSAILEPVMYAVPRNRRTIEKRRTRRMTEYHFRDAVPKTNIVICLNCGHPHEKETICGKCYQKVKEETEELRKAMGEDKYFYDHPRTEVQYLYQDDQIPDLENASPKDKPYLVEVAKNRPEWFPRDLVTKKKPEPDE